MKLTGRRQICPYSALSWLLSSALVTAAHAIRVSSPSSSPTSFCPSWNFSSPSLVVVRGMDDSDTSSMNNSRQMMSIHSSPFLDATNDSTTKSQSALIILNAPIRQPPSQLFRELWQKTSFHICADGGANRLFKATACNDNSNAWEKSDSETFLPSLITGDLDSLKDKVREYYRKFNVPIIQEYDQDRNDLDKSLAAVPDAYRNVFVYGAFGGRLDQEMASLQALFTHPKQFFNLWLYDDRSIALLLQPGHHTLRFCNDLSCSNLTTSEASHGSKSRIRRIGEGPTCGLIPVGGPCRMITTTGLQWDLTNHVLQFGGLVSTSNRMISPEITVECSDPVLFTAEVAAGLEEEDANDW